MNKSISAQISKELNYYVGIIMNKSISAQISKELNRLIFMAKRKYERMSLEERKQFINNITKVNNNE